MALRLLSNRGLVAGAPQRICLTSSSAPMSSLPTKDQPKSALKLTTDGKKTRKEPIGAKILSFITGKVEAANPEDPPIKYKDLKLPDIAEAATGPEKLFLLAFENGFIDPYCNLPVERNGRGTKDNPVEIPSFFDERLVACSCEPAQTYMKYTYVYAGEPKRCQCGHWLKLVEAPRFWEKIPKEDLLEISFFRDMEEDGYLDDFLARKCDKEGHPIGQAHGHHH